MRERKMSGGFQDSEGFSAVLTVHVQTKNDLVDAGNMVGWINGARNAKELDIKNVWRILPKDVQTNIKFYCFSLLPFFVAERALR